MRKIFSLAICFLLLSAVAAHAEGEIVVFDLAKVATECDAGKEANDALEKKFGPQKEALEKDRAAILKKVEEFKKKKPTEQQARDLQKQERELNEKTQAFLRLLQADDNRVRTDVLTVITNAATALAKRKGYAMVIDSSSVVYADPKLSVTNDMLTEANAVWKKMNETGDIAPAE